MKAISLDEFYEKAPPAQSGGSPAPELRQFQLYDTAQLTQWKKDKPAMTYNRRAFYKISLIIGRNRVEYADKVIEVEDHALLFATPKVPYRLVPQNAHQTGHFCIFTHEFLFQNGRGVALEEVPIFEPGCFPMYRVTGEEAHEINGVYKKMQRELGSDYAYKEDLLRNYVMELIHTGQKLRPMATAPVTHNAADRVAAMFTELLDRQFPIEQKHQQLELRTPAEFADRLAIHVNHLNKVLNGTSGRTTTDLINARVVQEAKILLKQSDWNISEIAHALGFQEVSHFSNFFRKHAAVSPSAFRS